MSCHESTTPTTTTPCAFEEEKSSFWGRDIVDFGDDDDLTRTQK
jgi:hypothetical protein